MTKMLVLSLLVGLLLGAAAARCEDNAYPTNIQLVEKAVAEAAAAMTLDPPADGGRELELEMSVPSDAAWLVEHILKERVIEAGWRLRAPRDSTDSADVGDTGFILRTRIVGLELIYGRSWRRYMVAGKRVERIARASMFYDLEDRASHAVVASSSVSGEARDIVPASALPTLTDSKYTFASPTLEKSRWDRYVEGGLVLAIVGVLVYLFYSNKTAS